MPLLRRVEVPKRSDGIFPRSPGSNSLGAPDWWDLADTPRNDPDQVLVAAAKRGDLDAFEALVHRHQAVVCGQVRAMVGSGGGDVDDIAQEVFVRAYRFLRTFRGDASFRSWLYRVAVNVTRTYHERRTRQQAVWADSGEGTAASVIDRCLDAADLEAGYLRRDVIERALSTLPPELRESLVLRDVHGFEYQEIAQAMDVPLGTVESRIFRARQRLRPLLAEFQGRRTTRVKQSTGKQ
jgi:RNA polymerase sigma-70 factor (ECF subfamily)